MIVKAYWKRDSNPKIEKKEKHNLLSFQLRKEYSRDIFYYENKQKLEFKWMGRDLK